jgi:hypothetical protein
VLSDVQPAGTAVGRAAAALCLGRPLLDQGRRAQRFFAGGPNRQFRVRMSRAASFGSRRGAFVVAAPQQRRSAALCVLPSAMQALQIPTGRPERPLPPRCPTALSVFKTNP